MASLYALGVQSLMSGGIDLINDEITAVLINKASYPDVNFVSDQFQSIVPDEAQISEILLTGNTLDVNTFRADSATFPNVSGALDIDAVLIYKDTNMVSTSGLIAFLDVAPEFPITPDGTDITINFSLLDDGIFQIAYTP